MTAWVDHHGFSAQLREQPGGGLTVELAGETDLGTAQLLHGFFKEVLREVHGRGLAEVTADLRRATFVDSSSIKALAWWLLAAGAERSYRIVLLTRGSLAWQRRCLSAVLPLVPEGWVTVVEEP